MQALGQASARTAGACERPDKLGSIVGRLQQQRIAICGSAATRQQTVRPAKLQKAQTQQVLVCRAAEQVADQSAGEGQISQQLIERMEGTLREELEADRVAVTDVYGDGRHVSIDIVSKLFDGQTSVKRQRMVYKAIWMELQDTVHAVDAMVTKTPAEVSS